MEFVIFGALYFAIKEQSLITTCCATINLQNAINHLIVLISWLCVFHVSGEVNLIQRDFTLGGRDAASQQDTFIVLGSPSSITLGGGDQNTMLRI